MDKSKIIKMVVILAAITVIAGSLLRIVQGNSMSLTEYEKLNASTEEETNSVNNTDTVWGDTAAEIPDSNNASFSQDTTASSESSQESETENLQNPGEAAVTSRLTGASLNEASREDRITYTEGFYYEPVSDNLRRYITGISYPSADGTDGITEPVITMDELRYIHIWHYDFDGNPAEGELICNESIAQDLVEIFYELYRNEYQLEKVLLIDEYDGDDTASMEDNNTSCFNYRPVAGSTNLSKHAYGLAVDINPFYNPYITYEKDGTENISPAAAVNYADRSSNFAYKIDENDLCYKLFIQHGFTWGGNWNSSKDYQHFQKAKP